MNNWITRLKQNILFLGNVYNFFVSQNNFGTCWFSITPEGKEKTFFGTKTSEALLAFCLHAFGDEAVIYRGKQNSFQATICLVFERNWVSGSS